MNSFDFSLLWPIVVLVLMLVVLRQIRNDLSPIFRGMTSTLAQQSARYAMAWAMAGMYAASASLGALGEVATALHWTYVAAAAKVLQPGIVAIIAFVNKSPGENKIEPKPLTAPPFNPPAQ